MVAGVDDRGMVGADEDTACAASLEGLQGGGLCA